jgi:hypothetical protein
MRHTVSERRKRWFFVRSLFKSFWEHLDKRQTRRRSAAKTRPLFAEALEPRVMFSATPAPVEQEEPVEEAPVAQEAPMAGGSQEGQVGDPTELSQEDLQEIVAAARQRWVASGISAEQLAALDSVNYQISDLSGNALGKANGFAITIDDDAAGSDAWFVDATPMVDEEFGANGAALADGGAAGQFDLLSTVMHEQGHVLGLADVPGTGAAVMNGLLSQGQRRTPASGTADGAVVGSIEGDAFLDAAVNVALNKPVIRVSSEYSGAFPASRVTDGSTTDVFGNNYWITPDNQGVGAFFTLDLQSEFNITEIKLRNTNNTQHIDRGTGGFRILASNSVDGSNQLISPQTILTGTLTQGSGTLVSFTSSNGLATGNYRYLHFVVDSLAPWAVGRTESAGLNEIEVYGGSAPAAPEIAVRFQDTGTEIADGDVTPSGTGTEGTDFGSVSTASGNVTRTFVVKNEGTGTLTLSGQPTMTTGTHFTVSALSGGGLTLGANETRTFTVTSIRARPGT